jgi:hypothetical protein
LWPTLLGLFSVLGTLHDARNLVISESILNPRLSPIDGRKNYSRKLLRWWMVRDGHLTSAKAQPIYAHHKDHYTYFWLKREREREAHEYLTNVLNKPDICSLSHFTSTKVLFVDLVLKETKLLWVLGSQVALMWLCIQFDNHNNSHMSVLCIHGQ